MGLLHNVNSKALKGHLGKPCKNMSIYWTDDTRGPFLLKITNFFFRSNFSRALVVYPPKHIDIHTFLNVAFKYGS